MLVSYYLFGELFSTEVEREKDFRIAHHIRLPMGIKWPAVRKI